MLFLSFTVAVTSIEADIREGFAKELGFLFFLCFIRVVAYPKKFNPSFMFQQTHDLGFPSGQWG
jgi:hypothetical protein